MNETAGFSSLEQDVACLPLILTHENTTIHNYNHITIYNNIYRLNTYKNLYLHVAIFFIHIVSIESSISR